MKKIALGIGIVLLVGLAGWRVAQRIARQRGGAQARQARTAAVAVSVQPVRKENIRDVRVFTGTVAPKEQFLVAPKVAGRLERLLVNIGQEVRNGDLIALLDSLEYTLQVEQARAELDVAKANVTDLQSALDIAAHELERVRELRKEQVASQSELDQAEANDRAARAKCDVALAQVKQKEAALKAAEVRRSYTRIAAAWEGGKEPRVVGERYVDEGAMLSANQPIVSILDIATVTATIFAIERDYPHVQIGQRALITTDAFPGQRFSGEIVRKAPLLKEASRQARVEIEVVNADRRLTPGMFLRAEIQFAARDGATVVPPSAVVRRNDQSGVFLVDAAATKARFVPVELGIVQGDLVEVLTPAMEGRVVTLGQHLLEDGAAIMLPGAGPESAGRAGSAPKAGDREGGGPR